MDPLRQSTPIERFRNFEKIVARLQEVSDRTMEELRNPSRAGEELVESLFNEYALLSEEMHRVLDEETERINKEFTRPLFENCRSVSIRSVSIDITPEELDYIKTRLDEIADAMDAAIREQEEAEAEAILKEDV